MEDVKTLQSLFLTLFILITATDEETVAEDIENNCERVCCLINTKVVRRRVIGRAVMGSVVSIGWVMGHQKRGCVGR
jgi:siroheme synthase (precorrin-2 oxidase/ferrochelatase)